MLNEDEPDLAPEPDEEEEYIQYDIATYPSDYTLSGIQELWHKKDLIVPEAYYFSGERASVRCENGAAFSDRTERPLGLDKILVRGAAGLAGGTRSSFRDVA